MNTYRPMKTKIARNGSLIFAEVAADASPIRRIAARIYAHYIMLDSGLPTMKIEDEGDENRVTFRDRLMNYSFDIVLSTVSDKFFGAVRNYRGTKVIKMFSNLTEDEVIEFLF